MPLVAPNFITEIIEADLASGKVQKVVTRFPPEPNGYAHLGHTFACNLNYSLAADYNGQWVLRMDDTNPETEKLEYVEAIAADLAWMGWKAEVQYASDDFEVMYECALQLIQKGLAYVDSLTKEEMAALRTSADKPDTPSPYRERSIAENLELFARMRAGEFPNGSHLLRAKIDLGSPNMKMRDPGLYRILHAEHYRQGNKWCIYPLYDYAQALNDAINGVTHSLCSLEFTDNRAIYDWLLENISHPAFKSRPYQYEFGRRSLEYTVVSKRKLRRLIETNSVAGWDDPRMPTIAAQRRRGMTPEAIRAFARGIGVSRTNRTVDIGALEYAVREDLNTRASRVMAVLRPLKVVLGNQPTQTLELPYFPPDAVSEDGLVPLPNGQRVTPDQATRKVEISDTIYIEQDDFALDPPKGFKRLTLGGTVRLRGAGIIRCLDAVKDARGHILELHCEVLPEGKAGGVIHWVNAPTAIPFEGRLYDRLFKVPNPEQEARVAREVLSDEQEAKQGEEDTHFLSYLNANSLEVVQGFIEPTILDNPKDARYQFERNGYFWQDPLDSSQQKLVFNRIIGLKDNWANESKPLETRPSKNKAKKTEEEKLPAPQLEVSPEVQAMLEPTLRAILKAHPDKTAAYKNGRQGLIGFFVGEAIKQLKGTQPQIVQALLRQLLE
ncbi:MAG: glutamine--tRNA ligase/YqeY domain fusion protein [Deinococcales bacterium]